MSGLLLFDVYGLHHQLVHPGSSLVKEDSLPDNFPIEQLAGF